MSPPSLPPAPNINANLLVLIFNNTPEEEGRDEHAGHNIGDIYIVALRTFSQFDICPTV